MITEFRYVLKLTSESGAPLGDYEVEPDWEPAREAVALRVLRAGAATAPLGAQMRVEPVWTGSGEPHAGGVRLACGEVAEEFPLEYFYPLALEKSSDLVEQKRLAKGDLFKFRLLAYRAEAPVANGAPAFGVEELAAPLDIEEADLAALASEATLFGEVEAGELPVFIPQTVLDQACAAALHAATVETGGLLIGHLRRDSATRDLFVVITAQVPAAHTQGSAAKLSFTPETWAAGRGAIALRRRSERMLGTWHTHPAATAWCVKCPPERQRECKLQVPFFSEDDVVLHRTVFPSAYCIGLVVTLAHEGLRYALFGWRSGRIVQRGFSILGAHPTSDLAPLPPANPDHHASQPCPQTD